MTDCENAIQGQVRGLGDWVLVPRVPTDAMLRAAQGAWLNDPLRRTTTMWVAMLAAAPQQPAAPSGEAGAFDANFLRSVANLCRAAYDLCQPKPQRTPEDAREHYGELCLLELKDIADEIERRLALAAQQQGGRAALSKENRND